MIRLPFKLAFLLSSLLLAGCTTGSSTGYHFSENYDDSIKTIAIPIFQNETLERGLELQLAESLNKQIRTRTPWSLTKSDRADTSLVGVITSHNLASLSRIPGVGLAQEQTVSITVRFEWRDNRTGDIIIARSGFSATSTFVPQRAIGERLEHGEREAIEELATDIVSQLRQSW
jgi:hypothetical protein